MNHKFPYKWYLNNGYPEKNEYKVFSCFACGGGSTMGYKLAGFDVLGMNEIDPKMAKCYIANHNPKYHYIEPIQEFKVRDDLPPELYDLDILDGSPPCSSFSMAGNRDKDWGKEKKFREGQALQVLDTLFFDFIDVAEKLQPKIVVAENVKGILLGAARDYVWAIRQAFDKAGYHVEHWTLDASKMGVPQRRERVFFVALRKDLIDKIPQGMKTDMFNPMPELDLDFCELGIPFSNISQEDKSELKPEYKELYNLIKEGESVGDYKGWGFNDVKIKWQKPLQTITANQRKNSLGAGMIHPKQFRKINDIELMLGGTFPLDYHFGTKYNENFTGYLIGMSVPPVMTAQIATRIKDQWLNKLSQEVI